MAVAASEEWVGEDICLFPCEDIEPEPGEALGHEQFDVELMKACCVHVGPHQVKLYMAKQRADDLSPDDLGLRIWPGTHAMAFLLRALLGEVLLHFQNPRNLSLFRVCKTCRAGIKASGA